MSQLEIKIENALRKIENLFEFHCTHSRQKKDIEEYASACGQFIGNMAINLPQRGIHGTAAALRVLSESTRKDCRIATQGLLKYLEKRKEIEEAIDNGVPPDKCDRDERNVIKISETLYAVSFLPRTDNLALKIIERLTKELTENILQNRGWNYFIRNENVTDAIPELIPTAYAIIGLSHVDIDVSLSVRYIVDHLIERYKGASIPIHHDSDIITDTVCLYALLFRKESGPEIKREKEAIDSLSKIWRVIERLMHEDIEQNIEYTDGKRMCYVRIPWQLYMLAITCKASPRLFSSYAIQSRLKKILDAVDSERGFIYPHSGKMISSRTNSILFDVLTYIGNNLPKKWKLKLWQYFDRVRYILGARSFRYGFLLPLLLMLCAFSIWAWLNKGGGFSDMGPNILTTFIGFLLLFVKR